ncbi:MAG: VOC family protein [Lachnospiraceae bacterium]|nr:VOC family protein [Lachnospiraceae bacterium]
MKIVGFNHFQLDSLDVEKTRVFYESLGGKLAQTMERADGWRGYHVRLAEATTIEIQPPRFAELCGGSDGWDHMALRVSDCEAACELIVKAGGTIEKKPSQNQMGDRPIINAVTFGLDGEKIELVQELDQELPADAPVILGVSHMQLNSLDVNRSRAFYEAAFDGKVVASIMEKDDPAKEKGYMVEIAPGSILEIQPPRFPLTGKNSAWNTIAIETDDIDAACEKIVAAGGIREVGPMKGSMGTVNILNAVVIGPDQEHVELIQII